MKLNNKGWGLLAFLGFLLIILIFLFIAVGELEVLKPIK